MKRSEWSGFRRQLLMQWYSNDSCKLLTQLPPSLSLVTCSGTHHVTKQKIGYVSVIVFLLHWLVSKYLSDQWSFHHEPRGSDNFGNVCKYSMLPQGNSHI